MVLKWDIKKFFGDNDFELWKIKMQEMLTQKKCVQALKGETLMCARLARAEKTKMVDMTRSSIISCLRDRILKEVIGEKTTHLMWDNLE